MDHRISQKQFEQAKELGCFWMKVEPEPTKDEYGDWHLPGMSGNKDALIRFLLTFSKSTIGDELYVPEEWFRWVNVTSDSVKVSLSTPSTIMDVLRFEVSKHSPSTMPISLAKEVLTVTGIECELRDVHYGDGVKVTQTLPEWNYKIFTFQ